MSRYSRRHRYERYSYFPQSKSKGERIADAAQKQAALEKKGERLSPVVLEGFTIASTFWGKAWCKNIESYHDYANRLPRGRSYVRSNSVIDLQVAPGAVRAQVMGSSLYRVEIGIKRVAPARWAAIRAACAGKIGSLIELLQGRISGEVMAVMTRPGEGLFPQPAEITFRCSCPDVAGMCKHIAAVMYGIGSRLDTRPELLFLLRGADTADLIATAANAPAAGSAATAGEALAAEELADVFGVEIDAETAAAPVGEAPTKAALPRAAAAPKRPRGRPRKVAPAVPPPVAVPAAPAPKRPRGRPRKVAPAVPPPVAVPAEPVPKRPRGRPRKVAPAVPPPVAVPAAPAPKRPRKTGAQG